MLLFFDDIRIYGHCIDKSVGRRNWEVGNVYVLGIFPSLLSVFICFSVVPENCAEILPGEKKRGISEGFPSLSFQALSADFKITLRLADDVIFIVVVKY